MGYLLRSNNKTRKEQNNNQTNNPHKIKINQKTTAPPLKLCVTPSSPAPFLERRGPLTFPGSHPNSPARDLSSLWSLPVPARAVPSSHGVGSGAGPGGGGLSPLRLAGTSGGDFSEGCPCQPPRLDGGPIRTSRG